MAPNTVYTVTVHNPSSSFSTTWSTTSAAVQVHTLTPSPMCSAIRVAASTSTAGASCAGGPASGSPTCTFSCAPTYSIVGSDTITCRLNGEKTRAA